MWESFGEKHREKVGETLPSLQRNKQTNKQTKPCATNQESQGTPSTYKDCIKMLVKVIIHTVNMAATEK